MRRLATLSLALSMAAAALPALAQYHRVPAEERIKPWNAQIPACGDPAVLNRIARQFRQREERFWNSALTMGGLDHIRPVAFRPWGVDIIPRRYCTGRAQFSDGRYRRVNYAIIEDAGIIGWSWGVEWCVAGLDRHNAYAPGCRVALH